jgi:transcription elongation factor GreB
LSNPNYITADGAKRLQDELASLRSRERPRIVQEVADAAAQGDRSENAEYIYGKKKLREIDRRMHYLTKRLETAVVVAPQERADGRIFFGATVEVEDEDGASAVYQIVGEDETDPDTGRISWRSPLGRALLNKREGDAATFRKPAPTVAGSTVRSTETIEVELTIVSVRYVASGSIGPG